MKDRTKKGLEGAYKVGKAVVNAKNILTFKFKVIIWSVLLAGGLLIVILLGIISSVTSIVSGANATHTNSVFSGEYLTITPEVERYREDVIRELNKHKKTQYTDAILAIIQQESGGLGNDIMQASESYCGKIGCITSPQQSIQEGIKHFLKMIELSSGDLQLALQSYNFGSGFITYVKKYDGYYTYELAVSYSQMMYQKLSHQGIYKCHRPEAISLGACYGDILYVPSVLNYLGGIAVNGEYTPLDYNKLRVTSRFGYRRLDKGLEHHNGIDYGCIDGVDPVYSIQTGTVVIAGRHPGATSYGNFITIKHNDTFYTTYAHLNSVNVKAGDEVRGGQVIGVCGNTGRSFGAHLHFETKTQLWKGHHNPEPVVDRIVQRILMSLESEGEILE